MKQKLPNRFLRFIKPQAVRFAWLLILVLLSNLLALLSPMLSGWAVDAIGKEAGGANFEKVFLYCGEMLTCYALSSLMNYWIAAQLIKLGQAVTHDLRKAAFDHLSRLPVSYFDRHPAGDVISRICYDVDTVNAALSTDLLQLLTSVFTVLGSAVYLLIISPRLSCVFVVTVPLSFFLTRFQMRRIHPLFRLRSKTLGQLNGFAEERMTCQRTIRIYGVEEKDQQQFDAINTEASRAYYKADCASATLGPSVNFINNSSLAAISAFGALMYLSGSLSLGSLSSFVLYSRKFSGPIREAANLLSELQAAATAAERIMDLLDEPAEEEDLTDAIAPEHLRGDIDFEHIDFRYTPEKPILTDFNAHIPAGSLTAVVGVTGAGKTTLVSLLLRFYTHQSGHILIDGRPISDYTRDGLRHRLALVMQDTWLLSGTIAENIAYGAENATREQIIQAAKDAHIHNFISSLPDGYDTVLTDNGEGLSKGQRQLLAIARCFLRNADIVILDEATSNVDTETEDAINQAMEHLREGRTCFVIAHRMATIRSAAQILVLENGRVAEQGTHEELLQYNGIYAAMHRESVGKS